MNVELKNETYITIPLYTEESLEDSSRRFADLVADGFLNININTMGLDFIPSRQIGVLIMVHNELCRMGGQLIILNVNKRLYDLFSCLNLVGTIPMERTYENRYKEL